MHTSAFSRASRPLLVSALLAAAGLLLVAGSAHAERPGFYSAPTVSAGAKVVGSTLVASDGSLRCEPKCDSDGPQPESAGRFFQWLLCVGPHGGGKNGPPGGLPDEGGPCPGAVVVKPRARIQSDPGANRYVVRPEDAGKYIQVEVIAVNYDCSDVVREGPDAGKQFCRYSEGHGWSSTFGPIAGSAQPPPAPPPPPRAPAVAPTYSALPEITGEAEEMQTLAVTNGTWAGTAPLEYAYQWLRCSRANKGCKPIEGATAATYTLTGADVAARITSVVTVSNAGGEFVAAAKLTRKIAAAMPREGHDVLGIAQLLPRNRLKVVSVSTAPKRLRPGRRWVARVTVGDVRGFLVRGARVTVADELGDVVSTPAATNRRGVAAVKLTTTRFLPLGRLVLTVTAEEAPRVDAEGREVVPDVRPVTRRIAVRVVR